MASGNEGTLNQFLIGDIAFVMLYPPQLFTVDFIAGFDLSREVKLLWAKNLADSYCASGKRIRWLSKFRLNFETRYIRPATCGVPAKNTEALNFIDINTAYRMEDYATIGFDYMAWVNIKVPPTV